MASQLKPFISGIKRYFRAYGGWSAVFGSPVLWLAVAVAVLGYKNWLSADKWADLAQSLIPSLLGFSLGAYTILLTLITGRIKQALKDEKNENGITFLDEINATFFHFIFVQVFALLWAFLYQGSLLFDLAQLAKPYCPFALPAFRVVQALGSFVGYALLVYSITLIVASALAVHRLAPIVDPADTAGSAVTPQAPRDESN